MLTLIYKIKLYLVDLKLKRLNNQYNKLLDKYKKKYLKTLHYNSYNHSF